MRRRLFPILTACARRITHWCYNPLVLRRRTCCPVSNTLFFFLFFLSLSIFLIFVPVTSSLPPIVLWRQIYRYPYAHFATANEKQYSLLRCLLSGTDFCWIGINERLTLALLRYQCILSRNLSTLIKTKWQLDVIFCFRIFTWGFKRDEPIFLENWFMLSNNHKKN